MAAFRGITQTQSRPTLVIVLADPIRSKIRAMPELLRSFIGDSKKEVLLAENAQKIRGFSQHTSMRVVSPNRGINPDDVQQSGSRLSPDVL